MGQQILLPRGGIGPLAVAIHRLPSKILCDPERLRGTEAAYAPGPVGVLADPGSRPVAGDVVANAARNHVGIVQTQAFLPDVATSEETGNRQAEKDA